MRPLRAFFVCLFFAGVVHAETIQVAAAISMKETLTDIAKTYESDTGDKVEFAFGASGQLQQQIVAGADIDVFVSAANKQVDELAKQNLIDASTRTVVAMNALVLIVPPDATNAPTNFQGLADQKVSKIAVGDPKTVPAGQYASQVFAALKIDAAVSDRLIFGANVRQVLTYVEQGEVDAGVVYSTDAKEAGDKVKVVATAEESWHEPIVYPAAVISASKKADAAKHFLNYLHGEKAQAELTAKGFQLPPASTKPAP